MVAADDDSAPSAETVHRAPRQAPFGSGRSSPSRRARPAAGRPAPGRCCPRGGTMTLRTPRPPRRGTAALEFAWVGPFLFFLVLGVWGVGRLIQVHQLLTNATRPGAPQAPPGQPL